MGPISRKALVEIGEPLCIDKGLQDTPDFKLVVGPAQPTQKPHVYDAIDVGIDTIIQPNLVWSVCKEQAHHLDDVVPAKNEARLAACCVELRQLLSQQRQHKADLIAELPARNEARKLGRPLLRCPLSKVGVALGLIQHKVETKTRDVIANARLNADQRLPQDGIAFAVGDALHQRDDGDGKCVSVRHCRFPARPTNATGRQNTTIGSVPCRSLTSSSVQLSVWCRASSMRD